MGAASALVAIALLLGRAGEPGVAHAADDPAPSAAQCAPRSGGAPNVICLAEAFRSTLDSAQRLAVVAPVTAASAARWSNLPCGLACRNGILLGTLSETQRAAALALARAALGASGFGTFEAIRKADDFLAANRPARASRYGAGNYVIAFLGEPTANGRWILQLGGHHHAVNMAFDGNVPRTATPTFLGVEPLTFTMDGVTYAPLETRRAALFAMLASLDSTQRAAAKLPVSFDDVLVGANKDDRFPSVQEGVLVSSLSAAQQARVRAAIESWLRDTPDVLSRALIAQYTSAAAMRRTRIAWAGSPSLDVRGAYVRIDGPGVWIEFVCQNGIEFRDQVHYHSIWRDRTRDYGGSIRG